MFEDMPNFCLPFIGTLVLSNDIDCLYGDLTSSTPLFEMIMLFHMIILMKIELFSLSVLVSALP